jgi:myo-inositol-1(or 4)-monophosphatase
LRDAELLTDAVRRAGALAMTMFRNGARQWHKPDGTQVTEADLAVDRLLREKLTEARPDYGWLSEESPDDRARLERDRVWIADPIDGTRSFARGGDRWCIAAALLDRGRPSAAAVYRPVGDELYEAEAGKGVRLNGKPLKRSGAVKAKGARAIGNRMAMRKLAALEVDDSQSQSDVPMLLRLCLLAAGHFDVAVSTGPKHDWDLAAGDLIVHEAGGIVTDGHGKTYRFNRPEAFQRGLVASDSALHGTVLAAMEAP